jgi:predicted ATPase
MDVRGALVGREAERARLAAAVERARRGAGALLLLSGEAGVGKTRLAEEVAAASPALVLRGAASSNAVAPYGPVVAALRDYLRARPGGLDDCGPLRGHLALLLPELGEQAASSDRATIFEAVRCAFAQVASAEPVLVLLDDLQWSDEATLELLAGLAGTLGELPLLVVGAYRSDGLPRGHRLRWLRNELRRGGALDELALAPARWS